MLVSVVLGTAKAGTDRPMYTDAENYASVLMRTIWSGKARRHYKSASIEG